MKQDGGVTIKHLGDITQISGYDIPVVDVITGGSPCQDLSVAGKRAGLDGERSGLFMEQMRIIREMRDHDKRTTGRADWLVRPRFMVWENVPGAFSSGNPKGADFQAVLEEIVKVVRKETPPVPIPKDGWPKAGCISGVGDSGCTFSIAWRIHDAQFWGAAQFVDGRMRIRGTPQRRKRLSLVADFGGLCAAEVLFERKGLRGDSEQGDQTGQGTAAGTESGSGTTIFGIDQQGGKGNASYTRGVAPTLAGDSHGTPHGIAGTLDASYYKGCGERNGVERDVVVSGSQTITAGFKAGQSKDGGLGYEVEQSPTLSATPSALEPTVITAGFSFGNSGNARSIGYQEECSPTIRGGDGGNQKPTIVTVQPEEFTDESYCLQGNLIDRATAMNGTGVCKNVSATLNSVDRHGVAYDKDGG